MWNISNSPNATPSLAYAMGKSQHWMTSQYKTGIKQWH